MRLAFETSVTWTPPLAPPERFQMHQVSMLPNRMSPASTLALRPSTFSITHLALGPEKYVAMGSPVVDRKRS